MKHKLSLQLINISKKLSKPHNVAFWVIFITLINFVSISFAEYNLTPVFHSSIGKLSPLEFYDVAVTVGQDGNVYLVDLYRKTIQKRASSGELILEFPLQDRWPRNVTIDQYGNLYTIDAVDCKVRKYSPAGELILEWGEKSVQPGSFERPRGIAIDHNQYVIVVDDTTQITAFDLEGNMIWNNMEYVSSEGELNGPQAVAIDPNEHIYVADTGNHRVAEYDSTGFFIGSMGSASLKAPVGIAVASDGNILVHDRRQFLLDVGEFQIFKFSPQGELLSLWGNKGREQGNLWEAHGIAAGPDNSLWVAGYHGHNVVRYDLNGTLLNEWNDHNIVEGEFAQIRGARVAKDGKIYVTDFWNQLVQVFDRYGDFLFMWGERAQGDGQCFNFPRFTATDSNENVYVSDDREIRKFDENGNFLSRFGWIIFPGGIAIDLLSNVWITESGENQIRKYNSSLVLEDIITSNDIPGGLNTPYGICQGPNGKIYVADAFNHRIIRLDEDGNYEMTWGSYGSGPGQFESPVGLAVDSQGRVYVSETWGKRIQVFSSEGEYLYGWGQGGEGPGKFDNIYELSLDGDYFIYAPDHGKNQGMVHKYALIPNFQVTGKPEYLTGENLGYFIWSDDSRVWHIRWSADGSLRTFEGTIHSTVPYYGFTLVDRELAEDSFITSTNRIDFIAKETNGEDGIDLIVSDGGVITFDLKIDGLPTPSLVKVGDNGDTPISLPLPFKTQDSNNLNQIGPPSYTPAQDAGYFIWQDADDGEWHIRWSGDSIKTYHYNGSLTSSSSFTNVKAYNFESNDEIQTGDTLLSFNGYAGAGEDGIDFFTPIGAQIFFDIYVDDVTDSSMVHVGYSGANPNIIPFSLLSIGIVDICEGDFDTDGDVDGSDLATFVTDFGRTDCSSASLCDGDFGSDGDVDGNDFSTFATDFGRTDCTLF